MSITEDTIAAIASAPGGAIGIIRLSGPKALAIARKTFTPWPRTLKDRTFAHGWLSDPDTGPVDEALMVSMRGPRSYTGEDVVEIHVHGGAFGLKRCLEVCLGAGARAAQPGEFTRRAFLNGRMDLTRAEGVADMIAAQTERALAQARALLRGELAVRSGQIRRDLLALRARIEVNIDFVDEEVPLIHHDQLMAEAQTIESQLRRLAQSYDQGRLARDGARIAIVGRPNAGKSSLFNALIHHDRAIVTHIPGTTRDTLEEQIDLGGIPVTLVDTAGLRDAPGLVEQLGVERSLEEVQRADLVLHVVDGTLPQDDTPTLDATRSQLKIASKRDLGTHEAWARLPSFSSVTGEGLDDLRALCLREIGGSLDEASGLMLTRKRQEVAVMQGAEAMARAQDGLKSGQPTELVAVDVQEALDALAELVGATSIEDVLDHLFLEFCIGK